MDYPIAVWIGPTAGLDYLGRLNFLLVVVLVCWIIVSVGLGFPRVVVSYWVGNHSGLGYPRKLGYPSGFGYPNVRLILACWITQTPMAESETRPIHSSTLAPPDVSLTPEIFLKL